VPAGAGAFPGTAINPRMKVLLSSGYLDQKARLQDIQEDGYHFLQKPYEINAFYSAIKKALMG